MGNEKNKIYSSSFRSSSKSRMNSSKVINKKKRGPAHLIESAWSHYTNAAVLGVPWSWFLCILESLLQLSLSLHQWSPVASFKGILILPHGSKVCFLSITS